MNMFILIDIYIFIPQSGCLGTATVHCFVRGPMMLLRRPCIPIEQYYCFEMRPVAVLQMTFFYFISPFLSLIDVVFGKFCSLLFYCFVARQTLVFLHNISPWPIFVNVFVVILSFQKLIGNIGDTTET